MEPTVRLEVEEGVARLWLCRPPYNIIDIATMKQMLTAVESLSKEPQVRVLVISADEGSRAFSAGVDISDHIGDAATEMLKCFHDVFYMIQELAIPTLAVVDGAALGGGCELATFCDLVVASERSKFGQPEIKVGVFAPVATATFMRSLPRAAAMELLLTGETISAAEAYRIGMVNRVVPDGRISDGANEFIEKLTQLSAPVLREARRAIRAAEAKEFRATIERLEALYLGDLMRIPDSHEGLTAFLEKRPPRWQD